MVYWTPTVPDYEGNKGRGDQSRCSPFRLSQPPLWNETIPPRRKEVIGRSLCAVQSNVRCGWPG